MNELERFGNRIAELEEKLEGLMRTGIGLGHSSFENGRINQYVDGQLGGSFGTQFDGSNGAVAFTGPTPPTPRWTDKWGPMAEGVVGGLRVRWEGYFEGGDLVVATMDHKEVEVHVSTQSTLDGLTFESLKTTITSARGGEVLIPLPVDPSGYYVRLTTRTHSGKRSIPSVVLGPFYPEKIREEDLGFEIGDLAGTQIFWGDVEPDTDKLGDLWLKLPEEEAYRHGPTGWELLVDQVSVVAAMKTAIGDQITVDGSDPLTPASPLAPVARQIGNGSIEPNSLVASDVIATGTVSAALLETILVLATTIVAGDPAHTHVKIKNDGVYVYSDDTVDGIPNEVIRMGTASNDFFGITDEDGMLITSLDDTGGVNGTRGNFREDVVVKGRSIYSLLGDVMGGNVTPGATCWYGFAAGMINGVTTELGLIEMSVEVDANRRYLLMFDVGYNVPDASTEVYFRVRDAGTGTPTINSPLIMVRQNHFARNTGWDTTMNAYGVWSPVASGTHRLLLTAQANNGKSMNVSSNAGTEPTLIVVDLGPRKPQLATVNRGGGSTAPPTRQYDTGEVGPTGWVSYRGDLSQRTDTTGPVQGWDPSGYNGNGKGYWWWGIPNITGTVDRVDVYLYSEHWYYNSGGTARLNLVPTAQGGPNFGKLRGDWDVGGWPKPGGRWITLPADWWPFFKNGQANGISVGPGPGTDLNWYGRFAGNAARLRIWYTQ